MNDQTMQTETGQAFMEAWILAGYELLLGIELSFEEYIKTEMYDSNGACQFIGQIQNDRIHPQLKETLKATAKAAYPSIVPMLDALKKEGGVG